MIIQELFLGIVLLFICSCQCSARSGVRCPQQNTNFYHGTLTTYDFNVQVIKYACHKGYKMLGESKQVCGDDGRWDPPTIPRCVHPGKENSCSSNPVFVNAIVRFDKERWSHQIGDMATVICETGYTTTDDSYNESFRIKCVSPGLWVMENSKSMSQCMVKRCPSPPKVPNAVYHYGSYPPLMGEGSRAQYKCVPGYDFVDENATDLVCRNRQWVGPVPNCVRSPYCSSPQAVENGFWDLESGLHGDKVSVYGQYPYGIKVHYHCDSGYKLVGSQLLECMSTTDDPTWSSIPPACLPKNEQTFYCPDVGKIENGYCKCLQETSRDLTLCQPFHRGVKVECSCNRGYRLEGISILMCTSSRNREVGTWDNDKPYCALDNSDSEQPNSYSTGDISDGKNHVSTLVIVIATACSVLGVLLLIMVIVVFRRRKPRPHPFHPGMTPTPYTRVHSNSIDEHDRLALMAYADATRIQLPTYEEATSGHCRPITGSIPPEAGIPPTEFRPLPSIPPTLRTNTPTAADGTNRHSTVTTSTMNRDGTSEIFGSLDTVNVSMSDASTSVTVETYDSGTSTRSIASQQARAGSLTSSDDNLANDDAPLLDNSGRTASDSSSNCSIQSQEQKED